MIAIAKLAKTYGTGAPILRGVDVTFVRGQVVAIAGPSGAGKSTLLRCINGLEAFDAGSICVDRSAPGADSPSRVENDTLVAGGDRVNARALAAIRRRVGFVFQTWNLFAHRTAIANIMEAPLHVRKIAPREARARAESLLERVGLAHRANAYPHELSGGEQQRVAIARALAMDPEALLLDEPTSALDPSRKGEVLAVLRALAESGMTMLLVTHDIAFAREVAHRAIVVAEGRIAADGHPKDVLTREESPLDR
jgi:polar amino acid transport system ATP-binding protein